jgi:hypothetical protein
MRRENDFAVRRVASIVRILWFRALAKFHYAAPSSIKFHGSRGNYAQALRM